MQLKKAQGRVMPVMLTCEGVMPERWIGYAKYINHLTSSKAALPISGQKGCLCQLIVNRPDSVRRQTIPMVCTTNGKTIKLALTVNTGAKKSRCHAFCRMRNKVAYLKIALGMARPLIVSYRIQDS